VPVPEAQLTIEERERLYRSREIREQLSKHFEWAVSELKNLVGDADAWRVIDEAVVTDVAGTFIAPGHGRRAVRKLGSTSRDANARKWMTASVARLSHDTLCLIAESRFSMAEIERALRAIEAARRQFVDLDRQSAGAKGRAISAEPAQAFKKLVERTVKNTTESLPRRPNYRDVLKRLGEEPDVRVDWETECVYYSAGERRMTFKRLKNIIGESGRIR